MPHQSKPLDLNLLPQQHRPRQVTALNVVGFFLVIGLLIGLIPVTLTWRQTQTQSAAQHTALAQVLRALQMQPSDQDEMQTLNQRIDELQARLNLLQAETGFVQEWQTAHASAVIAAVAAAPASGIILTEISQTEKELMLTGETESQTQVLEYAHALQATTEFTDVRIEMMNSIAPPGSPPVVQFLIRTTE